MGEILIVYLLILNNGGTCAEDYNDWVTGVFTDLERTIEFGKINAYIGSTEFRIDVHTVDDPTHNVIYSHKFFKHNNIWYQEKEQ